MRFSPVSQRVNHDAAVDEHCIRAHSPIHRHAPWVLLWDGVRGYMKTYTQGRKKALK